MSHHVRTVWSNIAFVVIIECKRCDVAPVVDIVINLHWNKKHYLQQCLHKQQKKETIFSIGNELWVLFHFMQSLRLNLLTKTVFFTCQHFNNSNNFIEETSRFLLFTRNHICQEDHHSLLNVTLSMTKILNDDAYESCRNLNSNGICICTGTRYSYRSSAHY